MKKAFHEVQPGKAAAYHHDMFFACRIVHKNALGFAMKGFAGRYGSARSACI
jgi:hypothetical protein